MNLCSKLESERNIYVIKVWDYRPAWSLSPRRCIQSYMHTAIFQKSNFWTSTQNIEIFLPDHNTFTTVLMWVKVRTLSRLDKAFYLPLTFNVCLQVEFEPCGHVHEFSVTIYLCDFKNPWDFMRKIPLSSSTSSSGILFDFSSWSSFSWKLVTIAPAKNKINVTYWGDNRG